MEPIDSPAEPSRALDPILGQHLTIPIVPVRAPFGFFRHAWDRAADGMRVTDADGRVRQANAAFCRLVGKSENALVGELLSIAYAVDQQAHVLREYRRRFASRLIPAQREAHITLWDGRKPHWELSNSFLDVDGETLLLSIFRDVTERLGIEEDQRRLLSERAQLADHLSLLLESTAEGIYGVDRSGCCTFVNRAAAKMLGYTPGELIGKSLHHLVHSSMDEQKNSAELCVLCQAALSGEPRQITGAVLRRRDAQQFPVDQASYPIVHNGVMQGAVVTFIDQTVQKQLEAQFHQAQKMEAVGRLAGGVAHDFNNLLTVILGQCDLLRLRLSAADPLRAHVDDIRKAGDRAVGLTRQLLLFSRKQAADTTILNLNSIVNDSKLLQRLIGEDIRFVTHLDPALIAISADPSLVHQLLLNLVVNARDAMPRGGTLTIETKNFEVGQSQVHSGLKPGSYVRLTVSDTGCGMSPEVQSHLFEPFFTTKEPGKGTGLGLSTVYGIVKQSGGHIEVISAPGMGATFHIYFPRARERSLFIPTAPTTAPKSGVSKTILVVEDEDMVRRIIRLALRWDGHTVLEASNGIEALRVSETHAGPIDLLLTDVIMPEMNGVELAKRFNRIRPETRILYISGYTDGNLAPQAFDEVGSAFLQKPFSPNLLVRRVHEILGA